MNVAVINTLGKSKSTGKIAYGLHSFLKGQGHHSLLFYGRPDDGVTQADQADVICMGTRLDNYIHGGLARLLGNQGEYSLGRTRWLIRQLEQHQTQAVYLLNLHGYYLHFPLLFSYLGEKKIKTIYLMLDEAPFLGKCGFSFDCERYQTGCGHCPQVKDYPKSLFLDRSRHLFQRKAEGYAKVPDLTFVGIEYTVEKANKSPLTQNRKLVVMDEAVDLRNLYYPRDDQDLRARLGIPQGQRVALTVAPFSDPRKGGKFFLEAARRLEDQRDLTFVHVGFDGDRTQCPSNYIPISYVKDQDELATYYSMGDIFVCTSLAETVANTCLEALSCGTPVLGFQVTGIPDCADEAHGTFVAPRNVDALTGVISAVGRKDGARIASCREYAERRYDAQVYFEKLTGMLFAPQGMDGIPAGAVLQ